MQLSYNQENQILASENKIILRLIDRSNEIREVYDELNQNLHRPQRERIMKIMITVGAFWNTEEAKKLRNQRKTLLNALHHNPYLKINDAL